MENTIKINDQFGVQGQLTPEQLQNLKNTGFKSLLNLRSPEEEGFLHDEQQLAEAAGLQYLNTPVHPGKIDRELTDQLMQYLDRLEQPTLIHCKSGMRAGLIGLIYVARDREMTAEQALEMGKELGFNFEAHPRFQQAIEDSLSPSQKTN